MNDPRSMSSRTVLVRIRKAIPELPPSEQRVAQRVLLDPSGAAGRSIRSLASLCNTSTTSVVRFYKRLGYSTYQDLRLDLASEATRERVVHQEFSQASGDIDPADSLNDIVNKVALNEIRSIEDTVETLNLDHLAEAVEAVTCAQRIDIFGIGASAVVGMDLHQKLNRVRRTALIWPEASSAWTSAAILSPGTVAIGISHSGRTRDVTEFLRIARLSGATTIALTNFPDSPVGSTANITLTTAARENPLRAGALGSRIAQLMIVDCLFIGTAQATFEESTKALSETYQVISGRRDHA